GGRLREGGPVNFGGVGRGAFYNGGPLGGDNNFVLVSPISATGVSEIRRVGTGAPTDLIQFLDAGGNPIPGQSFQVSDVVAITITGTVGTNDTLTINYGNGTTTQFFGNIPITFNGNAGENDRLNVEGGSFTSVVDAMAASGSGSTITYTPTSGTAGTLSYSNLGSGLVNLAAPTGPSGAIGASSIGSLTFTLPTAGNIAASVEDDGAT